MESAEDCMGSPTYDALNKAWKSTCRVLFGQEAGELSACREWLEEYPDRIRNGKSSLSGEEVALSLNGYSTGARFAAYDEIDFGKKFEPLSINQLKDIDSIAQAIGERAVYTGNVVLGNSSHVETSTNISNSHFVLGCRTANDSKYVAHSIYVRRSEYCFGLDGADKCTHVVKSMGAEMTRCFECHMVEVLADCHYCAKVQNAHDCMFCFGVENGAYKIGNTSLPKEKYLPLKKKLLSEIAGEIERSGKVFSLLEILEQAQDCPRDRKIGFARVPPEKFDVAPIDAAFGKTAALLFGRSLGGIDEYSGFLQKHVPKNLPAKSALSGTEVLVCSYRTHLLKLHDYRKRMATDDEMREIGKIQLPQEVVEKLEIDSGRLVEALHPVAYANLDKIAGRVSNILDATVSIEAQDCMHGSAFTWSKKCAYCFWASVSESIFGSFCVFDSSFCMKCYQSKKMARSFECDGCDSCADGYFLHNCENVRDSMFCFNAKNLSNAVGNAPLAPEQYRKVKGAIVAQLADELEKKKDLKWDIFNVGAIPK